MIYMVWVFKMVSSMVMKYFVSWPLTPIIVLFTKEDGNLPTWLSWFQTHDANMDAISPRYGKIDAAWEKARPYKVEDTKWKRYRNRCGWIWRNSVYGYNHEVLAVRFKSDKFFVYNGGFPVLTPLQKLETVGDPTVASGAKAKAGLVKRYLYQYQRKNEKYVLIAWQWYLVKRFKNILKGRCLRISIGYKLWSFDTWLKTGREEISRGAAAGSLGFQKFGG